MPREIRDPPKLALLYLAKTEGGSTENSAEPHEASLESYGIRRWCQKSVQGASYQGILTSTCERQRDIMSAHASFWTLLIGPWVNPEEGLGFRLLVEPVLAYINITTHRFY